MNSEVMKEYDKERIRLKAATGQFLAMKEPSYAFHMMLQHVLGLRAELNTLIECLSSPDRKVNSDNYFKKLIYHLQVQIGTLLEGMPGVSVDENGRVHGARAFLTVPGPNDRLS